MSLPVKRIYCDRCDFRGNSTVVWGNFSYRFADGHPVTLYKTLGWCYKCCNIVAVEDFSDRLGIGERVREPKAQLRGVKSRSLKRWKLLPQSSPLEKECWKQDLIQYLSRRDFFAVRKSPPRCLKCASTEIQALSYPAPRYGEPAVDMNFTHPGCGGRLHTVNEGLRIVMHFDETCFYDGEGFLLFKKPAAERF